ncbi:MAG TPA: biotin--[acetyl-CoA-carboxylase] ligase [Bacteroidota bacterium]|jgi:BirA family biotin operon repressor/biotin-[acetyl-CoA-carboxylase] ligase|nr:biotin--[acetyl-CoA-carboxylase] ligase [Bacteroidota bacterium]
MTEQDIREHLSTKTFGKQIYCLDTVDSTNSYAKRLASQGAEEGTVVSAEGQFAGRGRFNRTWISSPGKNLTFSLIIRPKLRPEMIGILSLYAAVALAQSVKAISTTLPACKWPNDVLIDGKKVCGILSEALFVDQRVSAVIIGVGMNVNQVEFPSPLDLSATSLARTSGHEFDRGLVLARVLGRLEQLYAFVRDGKLTEIVEQWQLCSTTVGQQITVEQQGGMLRGIAKRIDNDGSLVIVCDGTERKIFSGDVTMNEDGRT